MNEILKRYQLILLSAGLCLLLTAGAQAAKIEGVTFADRLVVEQTELKLRGVAVLKWALLFDVYAGAFYLPEGKSGKEWSDGIPKSLELSYFREIAAGDFGTSSDRLLRNNLTDLQYQALQDRLKIFYGLFRDVRPGDRYRLIYRPDSGTELWFNEEFLGVAPGADFAVAYFGIWLGKKPINTAFRDRLLGG